ncbi:MAG: DNA primase [Gammaproteobacteria bacterium]|nr:DNA primase [Gammaproteobacteria bacterium]
MAGLIPQGFIDELLSRVDIVDVVERRVPLKRAGKNHTACCPFHQEKTPSFSVQPEKQFFYCFGCGAGGNAIGFVQKFHNVGFVEAVEILARDAGLEVPRQESRAQATRAKAQRALYDCLQQASRFYQQQLRRHPARARAVDWCKSRGISGETAREFQLGYAPPGWENLIAALGTDEAARSRLIKAGLAIAREGGKEGEAGAASIYDRFRDRVVFPIRDQRGRTVGFGGRVLDGGKPKYLNSPETPVFQKGRELYGLYEARRGKAGKLMLVEGYMDVIALAEAGIRNAVATLGTATSEAQIQRMFRHAPEITFCFDGDEAGSRAAWRALETTLPLMRDGKSARFLFLPEGEDPDSMVRKLGKERFLELAGKAEPLEKFFFNHLGDGLDVASIEGRAALSNKALPLIRKLPEGVYRQLMLKRLAEAADVETETLLAQLSQAAKNTGRTAPDWSRQEPPDYGHEPLSEPPADFFPAHDTARAVGIGAGKPISTGLLAIRLLLREPGFALKATADLAPLREAGDETEKLVADLVEIKRKRPDMDYIGLYERCQSNEFMRGRLPPVITAENIEPANRENLEREFLQILDTLVQKSARKISGMRLRDKLRAKTAATEHTGEAR